MAKETKKSFLFLLPFLPFLLPFHGSLQKWPHRVIKKLNRVPSGSVLDF
jgi:hypothetical protein